MVGIFKAYDIRGVYPNEVSEKNVNLIAKAFGTFRKGKILVMSDVRKSSPPLKKAAIEGLLSTGATVMDGGIGSTPMAMFATAEFDFDAGLMITASHNPPEYNGVKLYDKGGIPMSYETGISEIEKIFSEGKFSQGKGNLENLKFEDRYARFLLSKTKKPRIFKVVIDCMNGGSSRIAPAILRKMGLDVVELRCGFNGDFPEDGPDPSKAHNIEDLRKRVLQEKADVGFAYDGDADRLMIVDENGKAIEPKFVFSLLIKNASFDDPNLRVVYDALTSKTVLDAIDSIKGMPIVCRVGHTYINQKLVEEHASLAGELSGHYYFKDVHGSDDALFASMKIIEYMSREEKTISELVRQFKTYYFDSMRIPVEESRKLDLIEELKDELGKEHKIGTLDGVKVFLKQGWVLFRPSNTEPKISVALEAETQKGFNDLKDFVDKLIEEKGIK